MKKNLLTLIVLLFTIISFSEVSAQCPPGWSNGVYTYTKAPDCIIIVKYCQRLWGLTGPPTGGPGDHVEVIIDDIEYYGEGCAGFRDDAQVLNDVNQPIFDLLLASYNLAIPPCPAQSETIIKLYAGDCRTEPVFVGYQVVPGQNGYITKKYVTKNCSIGTQNCIAIYTACKDENDNNVYTRIQTVSPPFQCGTTTIYCGECSPLGYITVQCNRFCF